MSSATSRLNTDRNRRIVSVTSTRKTSAPFEFQPDALTATLTKVSENVHPEIDRDRYHRDNNDRDDDQWGYSCPSVPDRIKYSRVCERDDQRNDDEGSQKGIVWKNDFTRHGLTPPTSAVIWFNRTISVA